MKKQSTPVKDVGSDGRVERSVRRSLIHRDFGVKYNPSIESYTRCFRIGKNIRKVIAISEPGVDIAFSDQDSIEICLHLEPYRAVEIAKAVLTHLPLKFQK